MQLSSRITGLLGGGSDGWGDISARAQMIADLVTMYELTIGEQRHPYCAADLAR